LENEFQEAVGARALAASVFNMRIEKNAPGCPLSLVFRWFVGVALGSCLGARVFATQVISSPDGNVSATVDVSAGNLVYSIAYRGVAVIETSPMGVTVNNTNLGTGVNIAGFLNYATNETFVSRSGIHHVATNWYQGQIISLTHMASATSYYLDMRVFNNGVAFCYELTNYAAKSITAEASGFVIPAGSMVWYQTATSTYETYYRGTNIALLPAYTTLGPPTTIQLAGTNGYLALTESALGIFGNPYLVKSNDGTGRQLQVAYPINQSGSTGGSATGPVHTPWNVIMIGADLGMIINNDIVESLAPPPSPTLFPEGAATSWATTGRSVWDWLQPQPGGITYTNAMTNSLWASRLGFEYNTVDSGWSSWNGGNPWPQVQQVVNDSHALGVKVLLWIDSSSLASSSQRAAFFQKLQTYGVDGFKADFFDFNSVSAAAGERVQLRQAILQEAAGYHLVANFHGTAKPTGEFRTYPNLIESEGIFGKEQYPNPWMVVSVPFTRFLAGPADYTPLDFGGNIAFEIANVINMPGPIITYCERSDRIAGSAFASLIRTIPSQWDQTIVLPQSQLGQTTATARRKGQDWYVGIMNATVTNAWNVPLTFLDSNVTYQADIVRQDSTALERTTVTRDSFFAVSIASTNGSGLLRKFIRFPHLPSVQPTN
jgi:alpha-glucosidase